MNMVIAGALSKFVPFEEAVWLEAMKERLPEKLIEINTIAFKRGRESI